MEEQPEIPQFYSGRTLLLTGAAGFIGKVLIWKLLYSCPSIKTVYILLRKKYGKDISERKDELFKSPIFDNLRKNNPRIFDKVVAIEGDLSEENVGLSEKDKMIILNEVSIVFHNAALLKMDAILSQAINVNTKGVIRMLDIAMEMKKLDVFCCVDWGDSATLTHSSDAENWRIFETSFKILCRINCGETCREGGFWG